MAQISTEWKQALSVEEYEQFCEIVSLYDLAFIEEDKKLRSLTNGLKLKHTVIAYDQSKDKQISVAIPEIDLRSKPEFVLIDEYKKLGLPALEEGDYFYKGGDNNKDNAAKGYKKFDYEAVKSFISTESFTNAENNPFSECTYGPSLENDIILSERDTDFEKKYITPKGFDYEAYNGLYISPQSNIFNQLFKSYWKLTNNKFDILSYISINETAGTYDITSEGIANMLKCTYIAILCPFYADIIDYKDFKQELSPDSTVVHKNVIVSASADTKRFDNFSDDSRDTATSSRPYIPTTTPLTDNFGEKFDDIFDDANKNAIGSLQTETFEDGASNEGFFTSSKIESSIPPFYYDKNSRFEKSDYEDNPIVIPKDGNLLVDGRIFSMTIDEIWEAIKRIESGRDSDSKISENIEIGYPLNSASKNDNDTRPFSLKKFNFGTKTGDPLKVSYKTKSKRLMMSVDSYVDDPDTIVYNIIDDIKDIVSKDFGIDVENISEVISVIGQLSQYLPAEKAYSLRELESLLRGLQYNVAYISKYANMYFTRVGKIGEIIENNNAHHKDAAGSLYQSHKDFINSGKNSTQFKGIESLGKITNESYGNRQDEISSQGVYMSAAGTWQHISQFMKLRLRDDEEF